MCSCASAMGSGELVGGGAGGCRRERSNATCGDGAFRGRNPARGADGRAGPWRALARALPRAGDARAPEPPAAMTLSTSTLRPAALFAALALGGLQAPALAAPQAPATGGVGGGVQGAGDTAPPSTGGDSGGAPQRPNSPGGAPDCGDGGHPTPAGPPTPSAFAPTTLGSSAAGAVGPEGWWTWWQLHKMDFLRPNLMQNWVKVVTRHAGDRPAAQLPPGGRPALADAGAARRPRGGRPAAARARRRWHSAASRPSRVVAELRAALADPSSAVRERALLALGATGSPEAAELLTQIARTGPAGGRRAREGPRRRPRAGGPRPRDRAPERDGRRGRRRGARPRARAGPRGTRRSSRPRSCCTRRSTPARSSRSGCASAPTTGSRPCSSGRARSRRCAARAATTAPSSS